jgi:hypothetical protein
MRKYLVYQNKPTKLYWDTIKLQNKYIKLYNKKKEVNR